MIVADLSHLDHRYRAKRSGISPVEYAYSIQRFTRPRRQWPAWLITAALLAGAALMVRGA